MKRKIVAISIFCLLAATGCMAERTGNLGAEPDSETNKQEASEVNAPKTIKLVGIGDSLTKGIGDESGHGGYFGMVKDKIEEQDHIKEVSVKNFGVKGHKTSNLQGKLQEEAVIKSVEEADIILMTIGGNDIMNVVRSNIFSLDFEPFRTEQKNYEKRLKDVFTTIRHHNSNAYIVFIGLYNPFQYMLPELPEINTIINEWNVNTKQMINKDDKAIFVSVDQLFSNDHDERLFYKDEFHPNEKGYSLIAGEVFKAIKEIDFEDLIMRNE